MQFPENLKYTKEHEWVRVEGGIATVGVTEFAVQELGEIVFADLPAAGKALKAGEAVCVVESTKAASDVYASVGGVVREGNSALSSSPDLVSSSPFDKGWLVKLEKISEADLGKLMDAAAYKKYVGDKA